MGFLSPAMHKVRMVTYLKVKIRERNIIEKYKARHINENNLMTLFKANNIREETYAKRKKTKKL